MIVTENRSGTEINRLIGTAQRENNKKRKNLIVNYLQGKHVPVSASASLELFARLAEQIDLQSGDGVMVIGFAETATAIGAAVSASLGGIYIHTSRENIPYEFCVADFREEHSHASEQFLFSSRGAEIFSSVKHIVFVEDELTTGKTILNIVRILKEKVDSGCRFYAASIINGMSRENLDEYKARDIGLFWLVKIDDSIDEMNRELAVSPAEDMKPVQRQRNVSRININGMVDPRLGCDIREYISACRSMTEEVMGMVLSSLAGLRTVDVIGTEEFMYPALALAEGLEQKGFTVTSHSATRSPIVPSEAEGYPLTSRCRLHSLYDYDRTTYLYNLYECDAVILITDADMQDDTSLNEIIAMMKTSEVIIVTWRK